MEFAVIALASYLIGAIPFAFVVVKLKGKGDIRDYGSGNVGATNVSRVLGRKYAILVYVLDFLKGALPVTIVTVLIARYESLNEIDFPTDAILAISGFLTIVGHIFPVYIGFRGGKGVATASGVFLALLTIPTIVAIIVFAVTVKLSRYISLGAILAAIALPIVWVAFSLAGADLSFAGILDPGSAFEKPYLLGFLTVISILIVFKHRANIGRIIAGTESKIGGKK
ncbi:MAG: glycerol-3-phosphate 1-O-acyltransferase PlsY [Planctomycetes bacterium]|nr:glycerol-3-phosphate 1-O-acyltransferase PlsY [Planctomycetota bacterium]